MAKKTVVIDDVIATTSRNGKLILADRKVEVTIPAEHSHNKRKRVKRLDVSKEGADYIDKMITKREAAVEKAESEFAKAITDAWKETLDLIAKIEGVDETKKKEEEEEKPEEPQHTEEPEHTEEPAPEPEPTPQHNQWSNGW